jgi:hypothetical protein
VNISTVLGILAPAIFVISVIPYYMSIFRGETKPSRASYGIWAIMELIWISSYISAGATTTKYFGIAGACSAVVIFILSIKHGMGGFGLFDISCLAMAAITAYVWLTTSNPSLAVYMSTTAVSLGYLPVIRKSYLWPKTENTLSWTLYAMSTVVNVLALTTTELAIILRPLIALVCALTISGLLLFPNIRPTPHN